MARGILNEGEVERLRSSLREHLSRRWFECDCGKVQPNGAAECKSLEWLFAHPGILGAVRAAMGREDILFTGNCDLHQDKLGNWHKDMGRVYGGFFDGDVFAAPDCRLYKVGVYAQDHEDNTNGFNIRKGSHRTSSMTEGERAHVSTRAGDVLIFDVRITHAGMLPDTVERAIWRAARLVSRPNRENRVGRLGKNLWWKLTRKPSRMSAFFTYGAPNEFTEGFTRNVLRFLQEVGASDGTQHLSPELVEALRRQGVQTYDFT